MIRIEAPEVFQDQADTGDGPFDIEMHDDDLLIMEGYDEDAIERARQVLFFRMTPAADTKGQKSK